MSLLFLGEALPSDSFVDFDDILNIGYNPGPSNRNPAFEDRALQCITDLVDCCGSESGTMHTVRGDWYFPNGSRVEFFRVGPLFLVNRGPYEIINEQQINGSVRLFRRWSLVPERGRFRCELPNAANPNVNQILYVNICEFVTLIVCTHNIINILQ